MTLRFITKPLVNNTGIAVQLGTQDSLYVALGGFVGSGLTAVAGAGSDHHVTIFGGVYGDTGVQLGTAGTDSARQYLYVGATGTVGGESLGALMIGSASSVVNHGTIQSAQTALSFDGAAGNPSYVKNFGTIAGEAFGITRASTSLGGLAIHNQGVISGSDAAIDTSASTGIVHLVNRGSVMGNVVLGLGQDIYDGRGGTVEGIVAGGAGNDIFIPGTSAEILNGGSDFDRLDFSTGPGVRIALDRSLVNTGRAAGDSYISIEGVIGSDLGNDVIVGDLFSNTLTGLGGNDVLRGGANLDTLAGGLGIDTLTGGTDADQFYFGLPSECGDTITDFTSGQDTIGIDYQNFAFTQGFGLPVSAVNFQSAAGHVASTAAKHFLFDTTDRSLWFDYDGDGSIAAIMIADLQAKATLHAADIILL